MSFAEKMMGLLARPNQPDQVDPDAIPVYVKYGTQLLGIVGAFFAVLFGLINALGIVFLGVSCMLSGILQVLAGFIVLMLEAPCCFICIDNVSQVSNKMAKRPLWNRAALYCIIVIPSVFLYPGFGSIFGCGLIFATGVIYGMMSLGKKASADEMRQAAVNSGLAGAAAGAGTSSTSTTSDRASIVNNAQPFSFSGAVGTDSNV